MSANHNLTERVEEYLAMRRAFGYRLTVAGQLLRDFARFAQRTAPASPLTLDVARGWAQAGRVEERKSAARRLVILRPFARFLRTIEPLTEIPPKGILGRSQHRRAPHIYTDQQLHDLLEATGGLRPCGGLRPRSVRVYLSLLACTGMRPPEPGGWLQRIETAVGRPLFPSRRGERLTRSGVRTRLDTSLTTAGKTCRSLRDRRVSPHLLRHTTALHLLQSGADMTVIALWLGHESTATTHMYVEADLTMKKRAIDKVTRPPRTRRRYQPTDRLLAFLEAL